MKRKVDLFKWLVKHKAVILLDEPEYLKYMELLTPKKVTTKRGKTAYSGMHIGFYTGGMKQLIKDGYFGKEIRKHIDQMNEQIRRCYPNEKENNSK